jgi:hypothetical protein
MFGFSWVCFVLDEHVEYDLYSARSQKQQSAGTYVAPLGTHYHDSLTP